ncbi:MAG: (2Fe-2S)-binding protein [Xanthomonadales bacterium]|nr:(2Fe-2S)-binding protein [Xanthomonadales bacterium]
MYICVCHAVTETAIRQAVRKGAHNLQDLGFQTGAGTQCGSCVRLAREIIAGELEQQGCPPSSVKLRIVATG